MIPQFNFGSLQALRGGFGGDPAFSNPGFGSNPPMHLPFAPGDPGRMWGGQPPIARPLGPFNPAQPAQPGFGANPPGRFPGMPSVGTMGPVGPMPVGPAYPVLGGFGGLGMQPPAPTGRLNLGLLGGDPRMMGRY